MVSWGLPRLPQDSQVPKAKDEVNFRNGYQHNKKYLENIFCQKTKSKLPEAKGKFVKASNKKENFKQMWAGLENLI